MKKISLLTLAFAVACAFTACSGTADNSDSESDSDATANMKTRVDTSSAKITTTSDTTFARQAAASSMAEIALGKLALTKSSNKKIQALATMMLKDHGNANSELKAIAKAKAFKLPTVLGAQYLAKKDSLKQLFGVRFDQAFVTSTIAGHKKILKLLQNEAEHGADADLKAFAAKTAITVQLRLEEISLVSQRLK